MVDQVYYQPHRSAVLVSYDDYSIDDLHQASLVEFEDDQDALHVFSAIYEAMRANYVAALKLMRFRRQRPAP
jgi:hypothetical protein